MFEVKIVNCVLERKQSIVNWFEALLLVSVLTVMIVEIDAQEGSHLRWGYFTTAHQLHK